MCNEVTEAEFYDTERSADVAELGEVELCKHTDTGLEEQPIGRKACLMYVCRECGTIFREATRSETVAFYGGV